MFLFAPPFSFLVAFNFSILPCWRISTESLVSAVNVVSSQRDRAERAYGFLNFIYIFEFFIFRPTKDEVRQAESAFCHRQCNIFATPAPAPASQLSTLWFLWSQSNARPLAGVTRSTERNFHFRCQPHFASCLIPLEHKAKQYINSSSRQFNVNAFSHCLRTIRESECKITTCTPKIVNFTLPKASAQLKHTHSAHASVHRHSECWAACAFVAQYIFYFSKSNDNNFFRFKWNDPMTTSMHWARTHSHKKDRLPTAHSHTTYVVSVCLFRFIYFTFILSVAIIVDAVLSLIC